MSKFSTEISLFPQSPSLSSIIVLLRLRLSNARTSRASRRGRSARRCPGRSRSRSVQHQCCHQNAHHRHHKLLHQNCNYHPQHHLHQHHHHHHHAGLRPCAKGGGKGRVQAGWFSSHWLQWVDDFQHDHDYDHHSLITIVTPRLPAKLSQQSASKSRDKTRWDSFEKESRFWQKRSWDTRWHDGRWRTAGTLRGRCRGRSARTFPKTFARTSPSRSGKSLNQKNINFFWFSGWKGAVHKNTARKLFHGEDNFPF